MTKQLHILKQILRLINVHRIKTSKKDETQSPSITRYNKSLLVLQYRLVLFACLKLTTAILESEVGPNGNDQIIIQVMWPCQGVEFWIDTPLLLLRSEPSGPESSTWVMKKEGKLQKYGGIISLHSLWFNSVREM